ncbi:MAG TPA: DUF5995 family protein [Streptosporangiaceae bacterium]
MVDRLRRARSPAPTHVLLGMNAHINYDMPQALIAVITYEEFGDPAVVALRAADHRGLGRVLADRVAAEDDGLTGTSGSGSVRSRLLKLINKRGSERVLRDPHEKVWANALALSRARARGPDAYAPVVTELEELSATKVAKPRMPDLVLLKLGSRASASACVLWLPDGARLARGTAAHRLQRMALHNGIRTGGCNWRPDIA